MADLHYVSWDAATETLLFQCHGGPEASCHSYPDCECEQWGEGHEHPFVKHDKCWMQDHFDAAEATWYLPGDGDMPEVSHSGPIRWEWDDTVAWEWLTAVPSSDLDGEYEAPIRGGQPEGSRTLFDAEAQR